MLKKLLKKICLCNCYFDGSKESHCSGTNRTTFLTTGTGHNIDLIGIVGVEVGHDVARVNGIKVDVVVVVIVVVLNNQLG